MKTSAFSLVLSLLAGAQYVAAHGFLNTVTVDGTVIRGNVPDGKVSASAIRLINDPSPIKGATNPAVNCGKDAQLAANVAPVNPGSKMTFLWTGEDGSNWPHNTGPLMTYMASCGSTTCDKFDSTKAKWFKIDQVGKDSNGKWLQQRMLDNGAASNVTLPTNIAPGEYLIRHEIIALHLANTKGGAEFYASCTQVKMSGSGTGVPSSSELVSFPGGYSDSDPGIFDPTVFDADDKYVFPGPPIAKLAASGTSSAAPSSTTKASSTGTCHLKSQQAANKRRWSRIMRDITNFD